MKKFPQLLFAFYLVFFVVLGIEPYSRTVWYAENIPIVLIVGVLLLLWWRGIRFSNAAYFWMSILIFLHTIGGHYTFERVPFDWFNDLLGFERNNYDRVAHFSVGFYAYPLLELSRRYQWIQNRYVFYLFPIFTIFTVASIYEIIEWLYAAFSDPTAGSAFLGSQGDIWDAQKDMLCDGSGSIFVAGIYALFSKK